MIRCPSCNKKILGEDLVSGVCSNCQHRLSVSDSASGSGEIHATLATEVSKPPLIDSVSGGLSGFEQSAFESQEQFASPDSDGDSSIEKTMQSDDFIGELSDPAAGISATGSIMPRATIAGKSE